MAAGKVLSRNNSGFLGGLGFAIGPEYGVGTRVGAKTVLGGMVLDDGIVVPHPEKRRKVSLSRFDSIEGHEPGQLVEEDFSHAPNISTSRWAVEDELDECAIKSGRGLKGRSSTPESGVTQKEDSDCSDRTFVVGFCSDDESVRRELDDYVDDLMEVEGSDNGGLFGSDSDMGDDIGFRTVIPEGRKRNMLMGCRNVFEFEKLGKISEGSYGIVYKAREKKTGEIVALKKLKMGDESEGFPVHFLREINTLLAFDHPSIVNVREVVIDDSSDGGFDNIYMVMDYVEHDLKVLMQTRKQCFSISEVKCLMLQLLEGVKYLHDNWVLHRDLKTSNILLNNKGELKICDFGMARQYVSSPLKPFTSLVVTLWYRAPELLLGAKEYSTAVDIWSVGCIMAELLTNKPLFDGKTELEQLNKIFKILGTPSDKIWPNVSQLPGANTNCVHQACSLLHKKFPRASFTGSPSLSELGLDLLSKLLTYDPEKRLTVDEALNHRWFQEDNWKDCSRVGNVETCGERGCNCWLSGMAVFS